MHDSIKALQTIAAVSVLSMASTNVYADPVCLPSTNADICVTEQSTNTFGNYTIKNDGDIPVIAFGVTNPTSTDAFTNNPGWTAQAITQTSWDAGQVLNFYTGDEHYGGQIPFTDSFAPSGLINKTLDFSWNTKDLGTYASLFGSEETTVNFYWQEAYPVIRDQGNTELFTLLVSGISANGFQWDNDTTFSNFVAFSPDQGIVARTLVTTTPSAVPVPAALPLMASALGLFGIARRKKA